MQIDINDIKAMEDLDSLIWRSVERRVDKDPKHFKRMAPGKPLSEIKKELYRESREQLHALFWGLP